MTKHWPKFQVVGSLRVGTVRSMLCAVWPTVRSVWESAPFAPSRLLEIERFKCLAMSELMAEISLPSSITAVHCVPFRKTWREGDCAFHTALILSKLSCELLDSFSEIVGCVLTVARCRKKRSRSKHDAAFQIIF